MQLTLTRRIVATSIAAALALGVAACGGSDNNNNNNPVTKTPKVTAFAASKTSVASGDTVTLTWTVADAATVSIVAAPGGNLITDSTMLSGSVDSAALTANTVFTLTAKDSANHTATAMVSVSVEGQSTNVRIVTFSASPNPAPVNGSTTLSWSTQNATSIKILQGTTEIHSSDTAAEVASGTFVVSALSQPSYTFKLEASDGTNKVSQEVTVNTMSIPTTGEVEPNDDQASATPITAAGITGSLSTDADVDFYSITVPAGGNVTAEITDGMGGCPAGLDTVLALIDGQGNELGTNDDVSQGVTCSKIDPVNDTFALDLPAGTYYLKVTAYPMSGSMGDYTLAVTIGEKACGNGFVESGEECDDGNTTAGDVCSPTCALEVEGTIMPPSGEVTVTVPAGDIKLISVVVQTAGQSIHATTGDATGACPADYDTVLALYTQAQQGLGQTDDDAMGGPCAELVNTRDTFANDLDAGSYFLLVGNRGTNPLTVKVSVNFINPGCGNGIIEGRTMEQCDDGNAASSDGCSATCQIEPLGTVMGPPGDQTFNGAIDPAGQRDVYQVVLTADAYIVAETFAPMAGTCTPTTTDTVIDLLDSTFQQLEQADDHDNVRCSRLAPLGSADLRTAGTYYVQVTSYGGVDTIPAYAVRIQALAQGCGNGIVEGTETCDDGNTTSGDGCSATCGFEGTVTAETEPNNTAAQATVSLAQRGQTVLVSGAIDPAGDVDTFSFEITGTPAAVKLQTHTVPGNVATCTGADTLIKLFDPMGNMVVSSDDEGAGLCSLIDGTGASPANPEAAALPVGRYTVEVHYYDDSTTIPSYFMSITLQ